MEAVFVSQPGNFSLHEAIYSVQIYIFLLTNLCFGCFKTTMLICKVQKTCMQKFVTIRYRKTLKSHNSKIIISFRMYPLRMDIEFLVLMEF